MNKRTAMALAAAAIVAATSGLALAGGSNDAAENGMPVPGAGVVDHVVNDDSVGMPVPGSDVDEAIVTDDAGMPVPGFEDTVNEMVVEGVSTNGMLVPGFEGTATDTVVEHGE